MHIEQIVTLAQLDSIKPEWERLYQADPAAHIFVSWMWLRGWFAMAPYRWTVLAARPHADEPPVAFLPLSHRRTGPARLLAMGGAPLAAYTGFICLPEYEQPALAALAQFMQRHLAWDRFEITEMPDPRLKLFLSYFSDNGFHVDRRPGMPAFSVALPADWDTYTQTTLRSATRRNLRRRQKQLETQLESVVTRLCPENVGTSLDATLRLWQQRWGIKPTAAWHRAMLRHCFDQQCLWADIVWDKKTPVSTQVALLDHLRQTFYAYITGYNAAYAEFSPGNYIIAYSLRHAVEHGYTTCDFLTGADDYKQSFGARQRPTFNAIVRRRGRRGALVNTVADVLDQVAAHLKRLGGRLKRSELGKKAWEALSKIT